MNKDTLLEEIDRLLDVGEPLLVAFPPGYSDGWRFQLPDNISDEMRWYVEAVFWRATDRDHYLEDRQQYTTSYLALATKNYKAGLLGWRAIGVLR